MRKDGSVRGLQAYRCGRCRERHLPAGRYKQSSAALKSQAVMMRKGGMGVRAIARMLGGNAGRVSLCSGLWFILSPRHAPPDVI